MSNWGLGLVIWLMTSVVFAGIGVTVILATPSLSDNAVKLFPMVVGGGFALAFVVALVIANHLKGKST